MWYSDLAFPNRNRLGCVKNFEFRPKGDFGFSGLISIIFKSGIKINKPFAKAGPNPTGIGGA